MTETLSLITVFVMALLLWREHRAHAATKAEFRRWSDRDEKGRFVKREKGSAL